MPSRLKSNVPDHERHYVREWRKFFGWTIEHLAELVGTSKATISRIENGTQTATDDFLELCAAVMEIPKPFLTWDAPDQIGPMWRAWQKATPTQRAIIIDNAEAVIKDRS